MPIFRSLDLERMLIYQKFFFYEKLRFFTQLSYHFMCKLLKKSYMLSNAHEVNENKDTFNIRQIFIKVKAKKWKYILTSVFQI